MLEDDELIIEERIRKLIEDYGADPASFEGELVSQIMETGLRLLSEGHDVGQLKMINRSIKEMRYAYRIFNEHKDGPCISIFGSARTPVDHPDYIAAREFSAAISQHGWMCITGAANGIMKASMEGPKKGRSFGLSIRLPFEPASNDVIEGDPKLIVFRYFFTRKLMFMTHSHALASFPGGFGTLDETFETLTLMQTGKSNIIPIVLLEGEGGTYWKGWEYYVKQNLLETGWIGEHDERFFYIAPSVDEAVEHVLKFYFRYHSSRYIKDILIIRMLSPLTDEQIKMLDEKYQSIIASGTITATSPMEGETDHLDLYRICFHHSRRDFAMLRMLIDDINDFL